MKTFLKSIMALSLCLALAACATWEKVRENKPEEDPSQSMSFTAPQNWMKLNALPANASNWRFTRDSFKLQEVVISYDNPTAVVFNITGILNNDIALKVDEDQDPSELADLFLGEIKKTNKDLAIQVIERSPTTIAGQEGFKLVLSWKNPKGLDYQQEIIGTVYKGKLLVASFAAVRKNFWSRDYPIYQQVVQSVRIK